MKSIYKYKLQATDVQSIEMPIGAEIISLQEQFGDACMWALVDTEAPMVTRKFRVMGTGHSAEGVSATDHVGTFQASGGYLVFHVFEVKS